MGFNMGLATQRGTFDSEYLEPDEVKQLRYTADLHSGGYTLTNLATICAERRRLRQMAKRNSLRGAVLEDMVTTLERRPYSRKAVAACVERAKQVLLSGGRRA